MKKKGPITVKLAPNERQVMEHALGRDHENYLRNWYMAGPNHTRLPELEALERDGFMISADHEDGSRVWQVTVDGRRALDGLVDWETVLVQRARMIDGITDSFGVFVNAERPQFPPYSQMSQNMRDIFYGHSVSVKRIYWKRAFDDYGEGSPQERRAWADWIGAVAARYEALSKWLWSDEGQAALKRYRIAKRRAGYATGGGEQP